MYIVQNYIINLCNTCNNNLNDPYIDNCIPCQQDHNDPEIEPKRCQHINSRIHTQASVVACGETNPHPTEPYNVILCTCDIANIYYHNCSDNSDTYYVYLRKNYHSQVIDTHVREALKKILVHNNIPLKGHGFHTFRQSGTTLAFDNNVQLQDIMAHGFWKSSSVWTYLENASQAPFIVPSTFARIIPTSF